MEALRSFFPTPGEGAIGALDWPSDVRKKIAGESVSWVCEVCKKRNDEILPYAEEIPPESAEIKPADEPSTSEQIEPKQGEPHPVPEEPRREEPQPVQQERQTETESTKKILLDFIIYSALFALIALLIDIIRHPIS